MNNIQKSISTNLLTLQTYKGENIGFFSGNERKKDDYLIVRGWWQRKNGAEGGELHICIDKDGMEVYDYDGCGELPVYVLSELSKLRIKEFSI